MPLQLNVIVASTRPGRIGPKIAQWFNTLAQEHGAFAAQLVDLAEFDLPLLDEASHPRLQTYAHEHTRRWSQSVARGDAFVFVTPEYDYFAPASLVNAVQVLSREWAYKPAGIVSYGGISAGLRSAQTAKLLLTSVNVMPIAQGVPVPMVGQFIGEDGVFAPAELVTNSAKLMLDELAKWATALQPLRSAS